MAIDDIRNFVELSDHLATAGQPSEQHVRELASAGFEVIVNLGLLDPRYCLTDEAGLTHSIGMEYHHIPVDFNAPQSDDLQTFFEVMDASREKKVFVHCAANYRSRVSWHCTGNPGWDGPPSRPTPTSAVSGIRMTPGKPSSRHRGRN